MATIYANSVDCTALINRMAAMENRMNNLTEQTGALTDDNLKLRQDIEVLTDENRNAHEQIRSLLGRVSKGETQNETLKKITRGLQKERVEALYKKELNALTDEQTSLSQRRGGAIFGAVACSVTVIGVVGLTPVVMHICDLEDRIKLVAARISALKEIPEIVVDEGCKKELMDLHIKVTQCEINLRTAKYLANTEEYNSPRDYVVGATHHESNIALAQREFEHAQQFLKDKTPEIRSRAMYAAYIQAP